MAKNTRKAKEKEIAAETGTETAVTPPPAPKVETPAVENDAALIVSVAHDFDGMTLANAVEHFRALGNVDTDNGVQRKMCIAAAKFGELCRVGKRNTCDIKEQFDAFFDAFYGKRLDGREPGKRSRDTMKSTFQGFSDTTFNVSAYSAFDEIVVPVLSERNVSASDRASICKALANACKDKPPTVDEIETKVAPKRKKKADETKVDVDKSLDGFVKSFTSRTDNKVLMRKLKTNKTEVEKWKHFQSIGFHIAELAKLVTSDRKKGDAAAAEVLAKIGTPDKAEANA